MRRAATVVALSTLLLLPAPALGVDPAAAPLTAASAEPAASRPNILVILVDDLGALDDRVLRRLPAIESLFVRDGVTFTDAHGESPLCCPGRAGFLTGLHTFNHGVAVNDMTLLDDSMTIATQLDGAGYHTFWAGKYMNGYPDLAPYVPPGWDRFHAFGGSYFDYRVWSNGKPPVSYGTDPEDYATDVLARKVLGTLRKAPTTAPFFGVVSVYAPHAPTTPAPRHVDHPRCATVPDWAPANYDEADVSDKPAYVRKRPRLGDGGLDLQPVCESLLAADDLVASVRDELELQGRFDDTFFVFASDNGMNYGAHRLDRKLTPYATQMPFFVSWPNGLGLASRRIDERIMNIDLAPTLCDLAWCDLGPYPNGQPGPDGTSFLPLLTGRGPWRDRDAVITDMPVRTKVPKWYAVSTTRSSTLASVGCEGSALGSCRWHYVEYGTGERELYDVSNGPCWEWSVGDPGDPCELENRAGDPAYAAIQEALRRRLAELKTEGGPPG
jgi:arylsulfatase A-like enzyme